MGLSCCDCSLNVACFFLSASGHQLTRQAYSIAKLCKAGTAQREGEDGGEKRVEVAASSLRSKLNSYRVALDEFSTTLDRASTLATLYCPAIKADDASARLG